MRFAIVGLLLTLATPTLAQRTSTAEVQTQLRQTERRATYLARRIARQLDAARTARDIVRTRCFDSLLSEVHALATQANIRVNRVEDDPPSMSRNHGAIARSFRTRLNALRRTARTCSGSRHPLGETRVVVEVSPDTPREDPTVIRHPRWLLPPSSR